MIYRIYNNIFRLSNEPPIHEGYLLYGKKNVKRWYFINTDGMFYINENNEKKMLCDLQLATVKDCFDKGVDREKSFMIVLSDKYFILLFIVHHIYSKLKQKKKKIHGQLNYKLYYH